MGVPGRVSGAEIEEIICSLINVTSARVVCSRDGEISEIHVLADANRAPKQLVRDIESALMAKFGLELDHKKISIAQTQDGRKFRFTDNRLRFSDVSISLNGVRSEAVVHLKKDENAHTGTSTGHNSAHNQPRLVATATLKAIEGCQNTDGHLVLEDVNANINLCGKQVVVVGVSLITSRGEDFLVGSAVVKQDLFKAVVNATLDAVNRRLGSVGDK